MGSCVSSLLSPSPALMNSRLRISILRATSRAAAFTTICLGACFSPAPSATTPASTLQPCAPDNPGSFPCRTPFDSAPVLEQQPSLAEQAKDQRAPRVWIFVDEAGVVQATQIERSAGMDFDFAAVALAKQFRFRPATADGRAVPAWVVMSVATPRPPAPCPGMGVPLSAGYAGLTDSAVLARPELGTVYRFRGEEAMGLGAIGVDVFIYPGATWPPPAEQAEQFLEAMEIERQQGRIAGFEVIHRRSESPRVGPSGPNTQARGQVVRLRLTTPAGEKPETYFGVFPDADRYVMFRATYPATSRAREMINATVGQIVGALERRPPHCPR